MPINMHQEKTYIYKVGWIYEGLEQTQTKMNVKLST